ncbi:hypothetical protein ACNPQN_39155 [Streptomyces sp. NPDC056297]|uniref:hypothetical protein n=1 Tax=unclassified Streptomyces TaxID=2593676 RepID=UPI0035DED908
MSPHQKPPQWIGAVPAVRVRAPEDRGQRWVVDDGVAGFDFAAGGWVFREEQLQQFVRWVLHGRLVSVESYPRYRQVFRLVDDKRLRFRRSRWWTSLQSVGAQTKHEVMRQRQEAAKEEREARQKQEEAAERRRQALEEMERARRAEEAERLRKQQAEESRVRMEAWRRQRVEDEARRAREKAEEAERLAREQAVWEEKERQALETANAWWRRLSKQQTEELFAAVAEGAWREEKLRVEIPDTLRMDPAYAYGVPLYARGKRRSLYGVVRPCPGLVGISPRVVLLHALVRSAQEARELQEARHQGQITHFDLPEHEQLIMC